MKKVVVIVLSLSILGSTYLIYNGLNNEEISTKEETLDKEFISYTLNGSVTDKSYEELVENNKVNNVTCENGSTAVWSESEKTIKLSNINIPDYCTIDFSTEELTPQFIGKILADNPIVSERTDFGVTNTSNTTGTIYKTNKTEDGSVVYYYSGNTTNNWVKFGKYSTADSSNSSLWNVNDDMYWRIIRTNEDGSVRLLYSGTSTSTKNAYIGTTHFSNISSTSRLSVMYMYGTASTLSSSRTNTTSSTIKEYLDSWYASNLLTNYDKYVSKSAIYCNDRSVGNGAWTDNEFKYGVYTRLITNKKPNYKCGANTTDGLFESTQATGDKFSVSTSGGGNGDLTYGVALMTADEVSFAGGKYDTSLSSPYAWYISNSNGEVVIQSNHWWLMSPSNVSTNDYAFVVYQKNLSSHGGLGTLLHGNVWELTYNAAVRPVISIDPCAKVTGTGTVADPYVIDEANSTCN